MLSSFSPESEANGYFNKHNDLSAESNRRKPVLFKGVLDSYIGHIGRLVAYKDRKHKEVDRYCTFGIYLGYLAITAAECVMEREESREPRVRAPEEIDLQLSYVMGAMAPSPRIKAIYTGYDITRGGNYAVSRGAWMHGWAILVLDREYTSKNWDQKIYIYKDLSRYLDTPAILAGYGSNPKPKPGSGEEDLSMEKLSYADCKIRKKVVNKNDEFLNMMLHDCNADTNDLGAAVMFCHKDDKHPRGDCRIVGIYVGQNIAHGGPAGWYDDYEEKIANIMVTTHAFQNTVNLIHRMRPGNDENDIGVTVR